MAFAYSFGFTGSLGGCETAFSGGGTGSVLHRIVRDVAVGETVELPLGLADIAHLRAMVVAASSYQDVFFHLGSVSSLVLDGPTMIAGPLARMLGAGLPSPLTVTNNGPDVARVELLAYAAH